MLYNVPFALICTRFLQQLHVLDRLPNMAKMWVDAGTMLDSASVKGMADLFDMVPRHLSDWRRMSREGKLVLPNLNGVSFVPVAEPPVLLSDLTEAKAQIEIGVIDALKGDVAI